MGFPHCSLSLSAQVTEGLVHPNMGTVVMGYFLNLINEWTANFSSFFCYKADNALDGGGIYLNPRCLSFVIGLLASWLIGNWKGLVGWATEVDWNDDRLLADMHMSRMEEVSREESWLVSILIFPLFGKIIFHVNYINFMDPHTGGGGFFYSNAIRVTITTSFF